MNWKLIIQLSLFGLAMAIATVYWIPSLTEPIYWLAIFIICAFLIARYCTRKYFLNGFALGIVNSIWVTAAHVILFPEYMANHPDMQEVNASLPIDPQLFMILTGPIAGAASGIIIGLFSYIAYRIMDKRNADKLTVKDDV